MGKCIAKSFWEEDPGRSKETAEEHRRYIQAKSQESEKMATETPEARRGNASARGKTQKESPGKIGTESEEENLEEKVASFDFRMATIFCRNEIVVQSRTDTPAND